MTKKKKNAAAAALCPCGSGLCLAECCGRYLTGGAEHLGAPTPEALMRSRYTAFALGDEAYLLDTWEEAHRPEAIWARGEARVKWLSLKVLEAPRARRQHGARTVCRDGAHLCGRLQVVREFALSARRRRTLALRLGRSRRAELTALAPQRLLTHDAAAPSGDCSVFHTRTP